MLITYSFIANVAGLYASRPHSELRSPTSASPPTTPSGTAVKATEPRSMELMRR